MRPGPKKPGESAAEYSARVKAMEQKFMGGGRPKTGGGASSGGGRPKTGSGGASSGGGKPPGTVGHHGPGSGVVAPIPKFKDKPGGKLPPKIDFGGKPKDPGFGRVKPPQPIMRPGPAPLPKPNPGPIYRTSGGGKMIANNPMTKMKRGGTVKGKK